MDYGSGASTLNGIFEWRDTVVRLVIVFLRFLQRNSISTQREARNVSVNGRENTSFSGTRVLEKCKIDKPLRVNPPIYIQLHC